MYVVQQNSAHTKGVYKTMRYVIVTGTSQGLGEAIAAQLLEENTIAIILFCEFRKLFIFFSRNRDDTRIFF